MPVYVCVFVFYVCLCVRMYVYVCVSVYACVSRFLFRKLVRFKQSGVPKRCVAGIVPFSGFLLKNQPDPPTTPPPGPPSRGVDAPPKPLPRPHPDPAPSHAQRNTEDTQSRKVNKRSLPATNQAKRPKVGVAPPAETKPHPVRQRGGLLLANSDQSSGEWSDSDGGDLIIDTRVTVPKKEVGKRKKEGVAKVGPAPEEEDVGEGEGMA